MPLEKISTITRCFQERFMGQMEAPSSWEIVKLVFLRKPDAEPKERDQELQGRCAHICIFEVVRILYCSSPCAGKRTRKLEEKLHVGGLNGISCPHLVVMATYLLHKHWE